MAALRKCPRCRSFVSPRAAACPECGGEVPAPGRLAGLGRSLLGMAGGGAIAITLMACYGAAYGPPQPPDANRCQPSATDQDGDCVATADDCNDSDPNIRPGAPDPLGDEIDQNCDGADGVVSE